MVMAVFVCVLVTTALAGCGGGRNSAYLMRCGAQVFGVDRRDEAIAEIRRLAAERAPDLPASNFRVAELSDLPFDDRTFDELIPMLETTLKNRLWLVYAGHDFGQTGSQTTRTQTLESLIRFAQDPNNKIWIHLAAFHG